MYVRVELTERNSGMKKIGYLEQRSGNIPYVLTEKMFATDFKEPGHLDATNRFSSKLNHIKYSEVRILYEAGSKICKA